MSRHIVVLRSNQTRLPALVVKTSNAGHARLLSLWASGTLDLIANIATTLVVGIVMIASPISVFLFHGRQ